MDIESSQVNIPKEKVEVICGVTARPIGFVEAAGLVDLLRQDHRYHVYLPNKNAEVILVYNPAFDDKWQGVIEIPSFTAAEWYRHIEQNVEKDMIPAVDPIKKTLGVSFCYEGGRIAVAYITTNNYKETSAYANQEVSKRALKESVNGSNSDRFVQGIINFYREQ